MESLFAPKLLGFYQPGVFPISLLVSAVCGDAQVQLSTQDFQLLD